jgi:hypothetical protein
LLAAAKRVKKDEKKADTDSAAKPEVKKLTKSLDASTSPF